MEKEKEPLQGEKDFSVLFDYLPKFSLFQLALVSLVGSAEIIGGSGQVIRRSVYWRGYPWTLFSQFNHKKLSLSWIWTNFTDKSVSYEYCPGAKVMTLRLVTSRSSICASHIPSFTGQFYLCRFTRNGMEVQCYDSEIAKSKQPILVKAWFVLKGSSDHSVTKAYFWSEHSYPFKC